MYEFNFSLTPDFEWDKFVLKSFFHEITQTTMFGEFVNFRGKKAGYISIFWENKKIGQCLIEISSQKIVNWSFGPIIIPEMIENQETIIGELLLFLKKNGFISVENIRTQKYLSKTNLLHLSSNLYSRIGETPIIDLQPSIEEIFHNFEKSVRKNINKCKRLGVEAIISEDVSTLGPYLSLLSNFRNSRNLKMPDFFPNEFTIKLFNSSISKMSIALAFSDDIILVGRGLITFGNTMVGIALASSKEMRDLKLPANDYLIYKAIEKYKPNDIKYYDLAGLERNPLEPKKKAIMLYKDQFASDYAQFGIIDRKIISTKWIPIAIQNFIKSKL